jgi:CubicO group peptidase (beta-lactamase class C family)
MSNRLPAGGYLTTAPDLARFAAKFLSGELVSSETREAMLTEVRLRNGDTVNYGLGWSIGEDDAGHTDGTASHGGSSPGVSGVLYIDPPQRLAVVFLTNLEDAPERLATAQAMARIVTERANRQRRRRSRHQHLPARRQPRRRQSASAKTRAYPFGSRTTNSVSP